MSSPRRSTDKDWNQILKESHDNYTERIDDTTTTDVIYIGLAVAGTAESDDEWQIQKIDLSSGAKTLWADGDDAFDNVYANRASLNYE